jgi:hypothetical protein
MSEINFALLNPVDVGALTQQGFATGAAIVKHVQTQNALHNFVSNPDDPHAYNALAAFDPNAAATLQHQQLLRRKELQDQQDRERAVALGTLATSDPAGAAQEATAAGDFDLADHFSKLNDANRSKLAAFYKAAGPIAYQMRQIKDPEQRKALLAQARPILEATGVDHKAIDGFDVTNDTALDGLIAANSTVDQLIERGKVVWHQQGESPSFATDSMGRPIGSQNPYKSGASPAATGAVAQVLSGAGLPPHVVAGFLGNFDAEGGYGGAKGDGGTASGIAQWRGERAVNFQRVIGKPVDQATPDEQAKFVVWEMQNPEAAGMTTAERDAILKAPTAEAAAALIDQHYERSSGQHLAKRMASAKEHAVALGAPIHVASKADYDKLPAGQPYIAPDGSRRVKS